MKYKGKITDPQDLTTKAYVENYVGEKVPSEGTAGQVLTKTASGSEWADASGLPSGGTTGQVVTKTASGSEWANVPTELPSGGTAGQFLKKTSSGTEWATADAMQLQTIYKAGTDTSSNMSEKCASWKNYVLRQKYSQNHLSSDYGRTYPSTAISNLPNYLSSVGLDDGALLVYDDANDGSKTKYVIFKEDGSLSSPIQIGTLVSKALNARFFKTDSKWFLAFDVSSTFNMFESSDRGHTWAAQTEFDFSSISGISNIDTIGYRNGSYYILFSHNTNQSSVYKFTNGTCTALATNISSTGYYKGPQEMLLDSQNRLWCALNYYYVLINTNDTVTRGVPDSELYNTRLYRVAIVDDLVYFFGFINSSGFKLGYTTVKAGSGTWEWNTYNTGIAATGLTICDIQVKNLDIIFNGYLSYDGVDHAEICKQISQSGSDITNPLKSILSTIPSGGNIGQSLAQTENGLEWKNPKIYIHRMLCTSFVSLDKYILIELITNSATPITKATFTTAVANAVDYGGEISAHGAVKIDGTYCHVQSIGLYSQGANPQFYVYYISPAGAMSTIDYADANALCGNNFMDSVQEITVSLS